MNETPLLTSADLILQPFQKEHIKERYIQWLNDPENVKYSELRHSTQTPESCLQYFEAMIKNKHFFWAIFHAASNEHIGNLSAYYDRHNSIADLAIMIGARAYKGKGFGKQAWQQASDYLLQDLKLRKITAGTMAINQPMLKIFQQTGMHIEAIRKKHFVCDDQVVDVILAAKFQPQEEK